MYKILYITNKTIEKCPKLTIPLNFQVDYLELNKKTINTNIHKLLKVYNQFLIDIDIFDENYNKCLKTFLKNNEDIKFWGVCKLANKEEVLFARNLGIYDLLTHPIQFDALKKEKNNLMGKDTLELNYNKFEKFHNCNILIVENNERSIELISDILDVFEMNLYSSLKTNQIYKFLTTIKFDLLIINANKYDIALMETIKKSKMNSKTPILFITNDNSVCQEINIKTMGLYNYIEKPINMIRLRTQVFNIIKLEKLKALLWTEKEKLDNVLEFSNNEIILMDIDFNIVSRNKKVLLFSEKAKKIQDFLWHEPRIINAQFLNFKVSDLKILKIKTQVKTGQELIHIDMSLTKIFNKDSQLTGFMAIVRDITEDIEIEQQKDTFIATLTHDLKTPIRAQLQALDLLIYGQFGSISDGVKTVLEEVRASCDFMKNMTDNLLLKYKSDKGQLKIYKEKNNLKKLLEKCSNNLKYVLNQKQQVLCINYKTKVEILEYDAIEIERVINNLITNASEYTPNEGKIVVNILDKNNNEIEIEIIDGGIGMTEEYCKIIFDKFVSSAKKYRKIGSGLGLYISRKIIIAHGGDIKVSSKQNVGTKFSISLPLSGKTSLETKIKQQNL